MSMGDIRPGAPHRSPSSHLAAACRPAAAPLAAVQRRPGVAWRPGERHCSAGGALGCPPVPVRDRATTSGAAGMAGRLVRPA